MRHRVGGLLLAIALLAVAAPSCSGSDAPGATTITVPALWAGLDGSGQLQSGIERAKVIVGDFGDTAFTLDLTDIEARNAGAQWRAATASAAAVAVLASAVDPASVDVRYTITGPIDGPSAGAILTVGTLAAIRGDSLSKDVTMTGTIAPDSTIGRVGDIPAKLRAASKAGFTVVLLPTANLVARGEPSTTDMRTYGSSLGLDVRAVDTLAQAYEVFTGVRLADTAAGAAPWRLTAGTEDAALRTTNALLRRLSTESASAVIPPADAAIVAKDLDDGMAALATGDLPRAYGLTVDGTIVLARAVERQRTEAAIASTGMDGARTALRADAAALRARAAATLDAGSDVSTADPIIQLGAPFALGWTTYADAVVAGVASWSSSGPVTAPGLLAAAAAIGEQRASIEVLQPDAITMLRSAPNTGARTIRPAAEFISDYTDFLVRAGQANAEYYSAVVDRTSARTGTDGVPEFARLALDELTKAAATIPAGVQPIDEETRQSALAATYFIVGTGLVSNTSDKGISGAGIGIDATSTTDIAGLITSVTEGARIVGDYSVALGARSIDPSSSVWSARWGVAAATALNGSGRDAMGEVIAQNELWYDVLAMASIWAATVPR